jgi:hypothetical protein
MILPSPDGEGVTRRHASGTGLPRPTFYPAPSLPGRRGEGESGWPVCRNHAVFVPSAHPQPARVTQQPRTRQRAGCRRGNGGPDRWPPCSRSRAQPRSEPAEVLPHRDPRLSTASITVTLDLYSHLYPGDMDRYAEQLVCMIGDTSGDSDGSSANVVRRGVFGDYWHDDVCKS